MPCRTSKITTARGGGFILFALEGALLFVEPRQRVFYPQVPRAITSLGSYLTDNIFGRFQLSEEIFFCVGCFASLPGRTTARDSGLILSHWT